MADGTAPTTGNLIENFFFRVDTADTEGTIDANFNIQLNLGAGAAGTADHLIQVLPARTVWCRRSAIMGHFQGQKNMKHEGGGGFGLLVQGVDLPHLERSQKCPVANRNLK